MARVSQEDLDALLGQAGGGRLVHSATVGKQKVPNPEYDKFDPKSSETLELDIQQWKSPEGHTIRAVQMPDGSWDVIQNEPPTPKPATAAASTDPNAPKNRHEEELQRQRERNAALPPDQDPAYETDAERRQRAQATIERQGKEAEAARVREQQEADRNKPGPATLKPDGKGGTVAVQTMPDGTIKTTPLPGVPSDAPSKYTEVKQDPNTGQWSGLTREGTWEPISGGPGVAGNQPLPADMPPFRPDPNKPGLGVIEYAQKLAALRASGKLTDKQFAEFVGLAHQQATAEAGRLDTIRSAQQQLQINEINQRATDINASISRLGQANQATQNAFTTSQQMASNFTPASYGALSGPLLPAVMAVQDARAAAWGGMYQPAPIGVANYPMLAALQQMGMTPGNTVIPSVAALTAPQQPNALGLGNVGSVGAPAGGLPAPIFGPPPAVPGQAPVQAGNIAPGMMSPNPPDISTLTPGVNPPAGQPGNDPTQPVGQVPVILPGVLQAGVLSEVAGSGRYPPEIVAEAARRLGWA